MINIWRTILLLLILKAHMIDARVTASLTRKTEKSFPGPWFGLLGPQVNPSDCPVFMPRIPFHMHDSNSNMHASLPETHSQNGQNSHGDEHSASKVRVNTTQRRFRRRSTLSASACSVGSAGNKGCGTHCRQARTVGGSPYSSTRQQFW